MIPLFLQFVLMVASPLPAPQSAQVLPKFEDYHVTQQFTGKNARIVLGAQEREFRTRLREGAKDKVNFAGHYVLTVWGCGGGCLMGAAIDATTGRVHWLPFTICCWPVEVEHPLDFRIDSTLIVFTGSRGETGQGVYYYKFEKNSFTLLKAVEKKQ